MKIVFFGTPGFAVSSLDAIIKNGYNVSSVVTVPDKAVGRGLKVSKSEVKLYAEKNNLEILQPDNLRDQIFLNELTKFKADLFIVVAFRKLPNEVWDMPEMGTINLHASLLPDYRGAAPINWAIINGEKRTGVTTFFINDKIDTGHILLQKEVEIMDSDTAGTLHDKLAELGSQLIIETIRGIENKTLVSKPQLLIGEWKKAPKIEREDCLINWKQDCKKIVDFIRGMSPFPGAWTYLDSKILKIYFASFEISEHDFNHCTLITDRKKHLKVAVNDGFVNLLEVQAEGKKRLFIEDFLRGINNDFPKMIG